MGQPSVSRLSSAHVQIGSAQFAATLVGDMLCLARLRSAISFASLFGVPGPNLIGLGGILRDSLGGLVLNLEGDDDTPSRRRVGLVGVEWRSCEGMVEVVTQELAFSRAFIAGCPWTS